MMQGSTATLRGQHQPFPVIALGHLGRQDGDLLRIDFQRVHFEVEK